MKFILGILLLLGALPAFTQEYHLPFAGRWFVMQGGDTPNVNHHMEVLAQWYGMDFMKAGGPSGRELVQGRGSKLQDYYSWGEPVLAPVNGKVVEIENALPDNPLGVKDPIHALGNHVVIEAATNRFVFLAHFQKDSVLVKVGQQVRAGEPLGKCGNSGNSDGPHIHLHVQDTPTFNDGQGQNITFKHINVELTGKTFDRVDWPLIRGLFVENAKD
jgi:hypothetical protein